MFSHFVVASRPFLTYSWRENAWKRLAWPRTTIVNRSISPPPLRRRAGHTWNELSSWPRHKYFVAAERRRRRRTFPLSSCRAIIVFKSSASSFLSRNSTSTKFKSRFGYWSNLRNLIYFSLLSYTKLKKGACYFLFFIIYSGLKCIVCDCHGNSSLSDFAKKKKKDERCIRACVWLTQFLGRNVLGRRD